jgi:phenylalanyl-tRNA synthetase beta chain
MNARFGSVGGVATPTIALANPLDSEAATLRRSLIPGLLDVARRNLSRGLTDLALFEIGTVFRPESGVKYGSGPLPVGNARPAATTLAALEASIPPQPWCVAGLFTGDSLAKQPASAAVASGLADALAAAHQLAASVGATLTVAQGAHQSLHPGRTAELFVGAVSVGFAGELLPVIADDLDLPRVVALWEIDLDVLTAVAPLDVVPVPISSFPAATQDLSLVVADTHPAGEVLRTIIDGAGTLLEDARLVDVYRGPGLGEAHSSLTFALRFRASDRTLTAAEATDAKLAAVVLATERHGATLRE